MKHALWMAAIAVTVFALSLSAIAQPGGGQGGQRGQGQGAGAGGQGQRAQGAQQQFGQMGGQTTPQALLRNAQVVTQLGITAEQTTALNALFPQGGRGAGAAGGGAAPQQPPAQLTPAERQARTAEQFAGIARILNAEQLKKFNDYYFQVNAPVVNPNAPAGAPTPVFNLNAYLLAAVDLTAAQKEAIAKIAADRDAANVPAGGQQPGGGGQQLTAEERQSRAAATRERNTKANDEIMALLTDAQKTKIEELKAGASAVRTTLGIGLGAGGQRGQGAGGAGAGGPNADSWQPGQGGQGQGQQRGQGGAFPRQAN